MGVRGGQWIFLLQELLPSIRHLFKKGQMSNSVWEGDNLLRTHQNYLFKQLIWIPLFVSFYIQNAIWMTTISVPHTWSNLFLCAFYFLKKTNYKRMKAWYLIHAGQVSNKQLQTFLEAILLYLTIRKLKHMLDVSLGGHKCVLFIQGFLWSHNF